MSSHHPHHQAIAFILDSLDVDLFKAAGACFGGGTLITLLHDEFRFSKDIDFMCPVGDGYRLLRRRIADTNFRPEALFKRTDSLQFPRELKADQYGVRFAVLYEDKPVKCEIVAEGRIKLEPPESFSWTDLPCLSCIDRYAEKLLANADRGLDEAIESRDLIDLAVMRLHAPVPDTAIEKAESAYPVKEPLRKVILKFQGSKTYRDKCFDALEIKDRSMVLDGLDLLAADFEVPITNRDPAEENNKYLD